VVRWGWTWKEQEGENGGEEKRRPVGGEERHLPSLALAGGAPERRAMLGEVRPAAGRAAPDFPRPVGNRSLGRGTKAGSRNARRGKYPDDGNGGTLRSKAAPCATTRSPACHADAPSIFGGRGVSLSPKASGASWNLTSALGRGASAQKAQKRRAGGFCFWRLPSLSLAPAAARVAMAPSAKSGAMTMGQGPHARPLTRSVRRLGSLLRPHRAAARRPADAAHPAAVVRLAAAPPAGPARSPPLSARPLPGPASLCRPS